MAYAVRIDDVTKLPTGQIEVKYTEGPAPLPATWQGSGITFPDVGALAAALGASETLVAGELKTLALAKGYKADPNVGTTFVNTVKAKTSTLDLTGLTAPIVIG